MARRLGWPGRGPNQDLWPILQATSGVCALPRARYSEGVKLKNDLKFQAASMFYSFKDSPELVDVEQVRGLDSTWSPGDSIADWKHKMRCEIFTCF